MVLQGIGDSYTPTPSYQQPVVTAIPLNVVRDSSLHSAVSPASAFPSVNLRHHNRQQHLQLQERVNGDTDRLSHDDHHYSEINSEPSLASPTSSSSSSSLSFAAAVATAMTTITSSDHVTETDTPTEQAHVADAATAMYSGLDTATMSEPPPVPSVYQTLNDKNPLSATSSEN